MNFDSIRNSIVNNKIESAIQNLISDEFADFKDRLLLLQNQYNTWQEEQHLSLKPPIEERNRIIYALLHIATQIEKETVKGKKLRKLEALEKTEEKLSAAFEELSTLKKQGTVDVFMLWLQKNHSDLFLEMKQEEAHSGNANTFNSKLTHLDVSSYLEKVDNGVSEIELKEYVLEKQSQIPKFFTQWELYQKSRTANASRLETKVRVLSSEHRKFFKNLAGGIFGGVVSNLILKKLEALVENSINDDDHDSSEGTEEDSQDDFILDDD